MPMNKDRINVKTSSDYHLDAPTSMRHRAFVGCCRLIATAEMAEIAIYVVH